MPTINLPADPDEAASVQIASAAFEAALQAAESALRPYVSGPDGDLRLDPHRAAAKAVTAALPALTDGFTELGANAVADLLEELRRKVRVEMATFTAYGESLSAEGRTTAALECRASANALDWVLQQIDGAGAR